MNERTNEERPDTVSRKNGTDGPSSSEASDRKSVSASVSKENRDGQHSQTTCPECHGRLRRADDDVDAVCDDCGLVVSDATLDTNIKLYTPNGTGDQDSRVGPSSTNLLHDNGLSTMVGWQNTDAKGNALSGERRQQMRRLRRWDERFRRRSSADRNLMHALGEIDRMASAVSRVEQIRVERAYRHVSRELGLEIAPTDPRSFIGRIASDVECTDATEREARHLAGAAVENGVHSGKHPVGIAAGALYAAAKRCEESLRQADIARAADVSEMTIRNRYPEILAATDTEDE